MDGGKMATQKVFCSYQEVIDLHTEADKVSAIGIHTPVGNTPHKMFGGFYDQFKKYKYLGCDITFVPAARLPVDPLGVSYEAGEPTIDPRDMLNPIMFHGCHGEDMGNILNTLYTFGDIGINGGNMSIGAEFGTDSIGRIDLANATTGFADLTLLENLYYKALTDNSWKKSNPQRGFRKAGLRPLIYKVAATHQIMPSDSYDIADMESLAEAGIDAMPSVDSESNGQGGYNIVYKSRTTPKALNLITNKLTGLGWMDTRTPLNNAEDTTLTEPVDYPIPIGDKISYVLDQKSYLSKLPGIFMGIILLPPAYKTKQYFRMVINHRFAFAGFRSLSFQNVEFDEPAPAYFNEDFQEGE